MPKQLQKLKESETPFMSQSTRTSSMPKMFTLIQLLKKIEEINFKVSEMKDLAKENAYKFIEMVEEEVMDLLKKVAKIFSENKNINNFIHVVSRMFSTSKTLMLIMEAPPESREKVV